ncbi:hypothetical protein B0W48_17730 [Pseudoalteromonas aliena]|uniref:Uncharacterized protein n=1 Tax=Pseudoalteromonas aliena TaxID=247523 RepID=A0A1Q2H295_9GAMM|nr:hypothetical protein [Pseudoalteromonas aliena]AQQ01450.1 hypothetical protein B0W48_17730 [Pseudoalteromonas aliena]
MSEIHFLNIDLDIESKEDISPIVEFWGDAVMVFRLEEAEGVWLGSFETSEDAQNDIVNKYHQLITSLPPNLRAIWDRCIKRIFDFGFEAGSSPRVFQSALSQSSISKLAEIGGAITVTIYASAD